MIIELNKINEDEEIALRHTYNAVREELEFDDCRYIEPISLTGVGIKQKETFTLHANIASACVVVCSRCLKKFTCTIHESLERIFDIKGKKRLDITNDVRETIIFLHDQQYLCTPDCKGICVQCGTNLNTGSCSCTERVSSNTTFAALKNLLNKKKEKET